MANEKNMNIGVNEFAVDTTESAEEKAVSGNAYTHQFEKPFIYEGKTYEKLSFDFGRLTGKDFLKIEQEMNMQGLAVVTPEYSTHFIDRMAVRASVEKISLDLIEALPLKDFSILRGQVKDFLTR